MRIIAMVNQKGGCGKTTSAINTAAAFAELGQRVLLVDFDPQAHATIGLGCDADALDKTIHDVLTRPGMRLTDVVTRTGVSGLDLAPCNVLLAGTELELIGRAGRELLLARALQTVRDSYDLCVIDCPPSLGTLTLNALVTSTDVIVPVQMHYYALEGLRRLLETVRIIHQRYHPYSVENMGVLLTFVEERTTFSRQIQQQMREVFGGLVFNTVIHRNIRLAEAPSAGESVLTYASQSKGAADYRSLAAEILRTGPMPEGPAAGRARRGMQKQLAAIFDGVWIPRPYGSGRPVGAPNFSSIEST
ncbi:MAG: ParA family protein [Phycisphaerae bacterium]|nr:ParA family protein [Phycisphaerae bacterium]